MVETAPETAECATGFPGAGDLLSGLTASLDQLVAAVDAGGLRRLGNSELVEFVAGFERLRNRLPSVDHQIVAAVEGSTLADELTAGSTMQVLTRVARVSRVEASRRVRAAEAVGPRVSRSGLACPPRFGSLAAVTSAGRVPVEGAQVAVGCLDRLARRFFATAEQLAFAEGRLVDAAVVFGPEELRKVAQKVEDVLFPDGTLADERQVFDARQVTLTPKADGSYVLEGRLTGLCGESMAAVITSLSAPVAAPDGSADERTAGQRRHDALHTAAMMLLRAGELPRSGGIPASIIVTVAAEDLLSGAGHAITANGGRLSVAEVMRLADEAELLSALWTKGLTGGGIALNLGRTRRCASEYQTKALIARDGGCSFPHCTSPPAWCDRHHVVPWRDGGPTDLDNLTLLCGYHHAYFEQQHWVGAMIDGLPHWIPPRWVDRARTPILHERIRNLNATWEAPTG